MSGTAIGYDPIPSGRASQEELWRQIGYFSEDYMACHLLEALPNILIILNRHRQIVYANRSLLSMVGVDEGQSIHGLRPGEAFGCDNARLAERGCGAGEACRCCGSLLATLNALNGRKDTQECRISRGTGGRFEALEFLVMATPLPYRDDTFTLFSLTDVSHEKRRQALERLFFHDILNIVGSIKSFAELLQDFQPADAEAICKLIQSAAEQTIDEIEAQRVLSIAENRELQVTPAPISSRMLLRQLQDLYRDHEVARGRNLVLASDCPDVVFASDRVLLGRVLGNMIKNALEATPPGQSVTMGCQQLPEQIEFWVHNPATMPPQIQLQVFQRSFSTKGAGRGLGTYGMKLLSEESLQGKVSFTSTPATGTVFRGRYPLTLDGRAR